MASVPAGLTLGTRLVRYVDVAAAGWSSRMGRTDASGIAPDSINLVGDGQQTAFNLPWVGASSGGVTISNNPNLEVIDMVR